MESPTPVKASKKKVGAVLQTRSTTFNMSSLTANAIRKKSKDETFVEKEERRAKALKRLEKQLDIYGDSSPVKSTKLTKARKTKEDRYHIQGANDIIHKCFPIEGLLMAQWRSDKAQGRPCSDKPPQIVVGGFRYDYDYVNGLDEAGVEYACLRY